MIKLILLAIACAFVVGILTYEDDKVVIDTQKAKTIMQKGKTMIKENIEVK